MTISARTRLLGIFGDPVVHSWSPLMQNLALRTAGIDAVYLAFRVPAEGLPEGVAALRSLGFWGVNVTLPHKEKIAPLLDEVEDSAGLVGAVNTVVNREGKLVGHNTDVAGFLQSLAEDLECRPRGLNVLLLGSGGAARAAAAALGGAGAARVRVANRTPERGAELIRRFAPVHAQCQWESLPLEEEALAAACLDTDLVVNATAAGLHGERIAGLPLERLPAAATVYDMVYGPHDTPLVAEATALGLRAADGLGMLAGQGEAAFELWTGRKPQAGLMKRCLLEKFRG